jgi:hypothetical protein
VVVGKAMEKYIRAMEFSSFFLLACGAVVTGDGALAGLKELVER